MCVYLCVWVDNRLVNRGWSYRQRMRDRVKNIPPLIKYDKCVQIYYDKHFQISFASVERIEDRCSYHGNVQIVR